MQEYLKHGTMAFSFGDMVLPVVYREGLNVLTVQMSSKEVNISSLKYIQAYRQVFLADMLAALHIIALTFRNQYA